MEQSPDKKKNMQVPLEDGTTISNAGNQENRLPEEIKTSHFTDENTPFSQEEVSTIPYISKKDRISAETLEVNSLPENPIPDIDDLNRVLKGRYRIEKELGKGGMGRIYQAYDLKLQRHVAIKTILYEKKMSQHLMQRFRVESIIAATLRNANIIQVYEVVDNDFVPLIIMEYVEGVPLNEVILKKDLPVEELINYFIIICEAVGYAHSRGVLHRDIKPSNIMITKDGQPKIMDFGIAKRMNENPRDDPESPLTVEGMLMGSPAYMSPEQARGDHQNLDIRSDVYSLGASIYLGLTRRKPFKGKSAVEVVYHVINEDLAPPSEFVKGIPADLEGICLKAMDKIPENRYQNAFELAKDLRRFKDRLPVTARRYGLRERIYRAVQREKKTFVGLILAVCLMFMGIAYTMSVIYRVSKESLIHEIRQKVKGIAATSSLLVDHRVVEMIQTPKDKTKPECRTLVKILENIKKINEDIEFVWIMRRSNKRKGFFEFVVENGTFRTFEELDANKNAILDPDEKVSDIGEIFEESQDYPELKMGFLEPAADQKVSVQDQWGVSLSGYAPIFDSGGKSIGVLGVDMKNNKVAKSFMQINRAFYGTLLLSAALSIFLLLFILLWIIGIWQKKS